MMIGHGLEDNVPKPSHGRGFLVAIMCAGGQAEIVASQLGRGSGWRRLAADGVVDPAGEASPPAPAPQEPWRATEPACATANAPWGAISPRTQTQMSRSGSPSCPRSPGSDRPRTVTIVIAPANRQRFMERKC